MSIIRLCPCPHCWASPGAPCAPAGDHLARFQRAERRGLITRADLAAAAGRLDVIAGNVIVPESAGGRGA